MKRLIQFELLKWKNSNNRKPLLIKGARQVGKTYALLKFGKAHYDNTIYLNFEGDKDNLTKIFSKDLNPERIILEIESYTKQNISFKNTLLIFDEIQACEEALTSLKYFYEKTPQYNIIAAGSLLGLAINRGNYSFPVGTVTILTMYPMSFEEFLMNINEDLLNNIKKCYQEMLPLDLLLHNEALDLYKTYLVVGGYPTAIKAYLESKNFNLVKAEQANISEQYISDMAKYANTNETIKSIEVFNSIPSQLAKENTKFQYNIIKSKARAKDYEISLSWLKAANVILENVKISEGKYPINIYKQIDTFKIYYSDVGLLCYKSGIAPNEILVDSLTSDKYRGLLAENYVAEQLQANDIDLHYWESNGTAEIDFVIQKDGSAIPIEVKSADNVKSKSLSIYKNKYNPKYSIRISAKNFGFENSIKSIPLYAVFCIKKEKF